MSISRQLVLIFCLPLLFSCDIFEDKLEVCPKMGPVQIDTLILSMSHDSVSKPVMTIFFTDTNPEINVGSYFIMRTIARISPFDTTLLSGPDLVVKGFFPEPLRHILNFMKLNMKYLLTAEGPPAAMTLK
jgi:hypothetical protein